MTTPNSHADTDEPKSFVLAWTATLLLIMTFVLGLLLFPPIFGDADPPKPSDNLLAIGRFHPIFVHLPVGILALVVILEVACLWRKMEVKMGDTVLIALWVGAAGGVAAVLAGILLSREGGFPHGSFTLHQGLGVASAAGFLVALVLRIIAMSTGTPAARETYRVFLFASTAIMALGAHFGGNMVHGRQYLVEKMPKWMAKPVTELEDWLLEWVDKPKEGPAATEPLMTQDGNANPAQPSPAPPAPPTPPPTPVIAKGETTSSPQPPSPGPTPTPPSPPTSVAVAGNEVFIAADSSKLVFEHLVLPVLEAKCNSCHNGEKKPKGGLRMDTHTLLLKGGDDEGKTVVPGKPDESLAILRIMLPIEDDEHMAPEGKDQMTPEETSLLRWWILEGASDTLKVKDARFPPDVKTLVEQKLANGSP